MSESRSNNWKGIEEVQTTYHVEEGNKPGKPLLLDWILKGGVRQCSDDTVPVVKPPLLAFCFQSRFVASCMAKAGKNKPIRSFTEI